MAALRELISGLRTGNSRGDNALVPAVRRQARRFALLFGIEIEIDCPDTLPTTRALASSLFHMVNEALNNVRKHTCARQVWITLSVEPAVFRLVVRDDGGTRTRPACRPTSARLAERAGRRARRHAGRRPSRRTEHRTRHPDSPLASVLRWSEVMAHLALPQDPARASPRPIRVFVAEDHQITFWGLRRLIDASRPRMEVVGTATSRAELLSNDAIADVDVILLDLDLAGEDSAGLAERAAPALPGSRAGTDRQQTTSPSTARRCSRARAVWCTSPSRPKRSCARSRRSAVARYG